MNKDQALLLALSALYDSIPGSPEWIAKREQSAAAIREVIDPSQLDLVLKRYSFDRRGSKHTAPPQRKPLSEEEIQAIWKKTFESELSPNTFARAIEAAHGIKT